MQRGGVTSNCRCREHASPKIFGAPAGGPSLSSEAVGPWNNNTGPKCQKGAVATTSRARIHALRVGVPRQTVDFLSRTAEALAGCRALFDRLDSEEEAQKLCRSQVQGGHRLPMEIYLFMSSTHNKFGFTGDPGGANLPIELAPWEEAGSVTNASWLATDVTDAIKRHGFYVMSKK